MIATFLIIPLAGSLAVAACSQAGLRAWLVLATALGTSALAITLLVIHGLGPAVSIQSGGWVAPLGICLRHDALTRAMLLLTGAISTAAALALLDLKADCGRPHERAYHVSFPLLMLALNGLFLAGDFFNFYVFFELMAIASYLLVAMGSHYPFEAAWKYAAQSVLASVALLAGVAWIYGTVGTLDMADAAARGGADGSASAAWVMPILAVACFIKAAVIPFHWWQPDAHAAASSPGSAVLAGLLINIGPYALMRLWPVVASDALLWVVLGVGAVSLVVGAMAAWRTSDAKRLLGFSSSSQLGFVLLAIGWGTTTAWAAAVTFLIAHALAKALLFLAVGALAEQHGATRLAILAGSGRGHPWLQATIGIALCSLIGLPPAVGFATKLAVVGAGVGVGDWSGVTVAAAGTVLTMGYCLRLYQVLFQEPAYPVDLRATTGPAGASAMALLAALVIAGGIAADQLWSFGIASADAAVALAGAQP